MADNRRVSIFRHDLKTYINHITGYSEILREDAVEYHRADIMAGLNGILSVTQQLRNLIDLYFDPSANQVPVIYDDLRSIFFPPIMHIMTDARRLLVLFRTSAPGFVRDMEQLLASTGDMFERVETIAVEKDVEQRESELKTSHAPNFLPAFKDNEYPDELPGEQALQPARILVIDDNHLSQNLLERHLTAIGHQVIQAYSSEEAFSLLESGPSIDIIILDVLMPTVSGIITLQNLKKHPQFAAIPVIMMSEVDSTASIAQSIKLGAEDYLPKNFDPSILRARISACLEKHRLYKQQRLYVQALLESRTALEKELADAGTFVVGLIPNPLEGTIQSAIKMRPSSMLGGDFASCQYLDETHISMYLLDVAGHGVKSALLAVSISNTLRTQALPATDFQNPERVLFALNNNYQNCDVEPVFFTIWYGVYNTETRLLTFSNGGSPPACLISKGSIDQLSTGEILLGAVPDAVFPSQSITIKANDRLFLFSDGLYEITKPNDSMVGLDGLLPLLLADSGVPAFDVENIISMTLSIAHRDKFDDDVCLLEMKF